MHFFSGGERDRAAGGRSLFERTGKRRARNDDAARQALGKGREWSRVSATASSATACCRSTLQQSLFLLDEGCTPAQVDRAMTDWGMAMGPFAVGDLSGLDIGWAIRQRRRSEGSSMVYSAVADRICEAGRLGQKTGKGWYRYEAGSRTPIADPETDRIIDAYRKEVGIAPRAISAEEIVERMVYALVNEGATILEEGIALRASDIDIVYLTGYGFPAHRRSDVPCRQRGPRHGDGCHERLSKGYHGRPVDPVTAACPPCSDRREIQQLIGALMAQAVIVSTARTPLAKAHAVPST